MFFCDSEISTAFFIIFSTVCLLEAIALCLLVLLVASSQSFHYLSIPKTFSSRATREFLGKSVLRKRYPLEAKMGKRFIWFYYRISICFFMSSILRQWFSAVAFCRLLGCDLVKFTCVCCFLCFSSRLPAITSWIQKATCRKERYKSVPFPQFWDFQIVFGSFFSPILIKLMSLFMRQTHRFHS